MKKSSFIKTSFILIIGGFITKILGMIIRIFINRILDTETIGLYMMIIPTFSLLTSIATFSFPIAISKLISEDKYDNKNIIISLIPITIIINILIIIFLILFSNYISNNLLHDNRLINPIICIGLVLPFISISSILRGYYFGKQRMIPHVITLIIEDLIRLILIIIFLPSVNNKISFLILISIVSELSSIVILLKLIPNKNISINDFKLTNIKKVLNISIPTTISRIIGNIGYFLEPIIITNILIYLGYSNKFILNEYGIISGYVIPLILLPTFFSNAIMSALIPNISKYSYNKEYVKRKIKQAISLSLIISIPITVSIMIKPSFFLYFIYHTNKGITYLLVLAPICILKYIEAPISGTLQALNKSSIILKCTIYNTIIRTISLLLFSLLHIGLWGYIISISLSIIFSTLYQTKKTYKSLL